MYNTINNTLVSHGMTIPPVSIRNDGFTRWDNGAWIKPVAGGYIFGDFKKGLSSYWFSEPDRKLSKSELAERKRLIAEERKKLEQERLEGYLEIAAQASQEYNQFSSDCSDSQYLKIKQVEALDIKSDSKNIVIPARDVHGKLWTYQIIAGDGSKLFKKGGKKKGCFHTVGDIANADRVFVCEGYATAASIHMALGYTTIVAFDSGNLDPVIKSLRTKYPNLEVITAADDDRWKLTNTGREAAEQVYLKHGARFTVPIFKAEFDDSKPTDFNDLHVLQGIGEVREQLAWV